MLLENCWAKYHCIKHVKVSDRVPGGYKGAPLAELTREIQDDVLTLKSVAGTLAL